VSGDLYNAQGDRIGHVDFSGGRVTDRSGQSVGKVMTYGSGTIESAEGWRRGEVSMSGAVEDNEGRTVGRVSGTSVYDNNGYTVGSVDAQTRTTWVTGITDAHKAGGALLLLILKKGN
jgi:5-fold beta-flower protein